MEEDVGGNKVLFNVGSRYRCDNEFDIKWEYKKIECKCLLDRVMFDEVNKKIILIEVKRRSDIYKLKDWVEEFDYYREIGF